MVRDQVDRLNAATHAELVDDRRAWLKFFVFVALLALLLGGLLYWDGWWAQ